MGGVAGAGAGSIFKNPSLLFHTWGGVTYIVLLLDGVYLRWGVRDGYDVEDWTLTATGFNGTENTDWENVNAIEL
jgi:hypothetical protein